MYVYLFISIGFAFMIGKLGTAKIYYTNKEQLLVSRNI